MEPNELLATHFERAREQAAKFCQRSRLTHLAAEMESAAIWGLYKAARKADSINDFNGYAWRTIHREMLQVLRSAARKGVMTTQEFCDGAELHMVAGDATPVAPKTGELRVMIGEVKAGIKKLGDRDQKVIDMVFYRETLLAEVETALGLRRSRVFRVRQEAVNNLRDAIRLKRG